MSVEEPKRTLAYICPACRQSVIVERDLFSLAAATAHIKCPCGRSELRVEFVDDHVDLEVPCLFCGREHRVSCSTHAFLHQKALAFSCAASGLDCLYVGEEEPVFQALERLEQAVDRLVLESQAEEKGAFLDELVMGEVLGEIKEIAQRGGISCQCGSKDYGIKVGYSAVELICARCGATLRLPAATADDIDDICCKTTLTIGKKEE